MSYINGVIFIGRDPRVQYSGACYHIIQRGNNQEKIFKRDKEKLFFLELLRAVRIKFNCLIFAYTIMDNHYHLLIQIQTENLSQIMHRLNSRYAQYYNWRHNRKGHVFQGRFLSYLITDDLYLVTVLRYIHQNAVRARIVENISEYRWCSDRDYRNQLNDLVETSFVLDIFSKDRQKALQIYSELMGEPLTDKEKKMAYEKFYHDPFQTKTEADIKSNGIIPSIQIPDRSGFLDEILKSCCSNNIEFSIIKSGGRSRDFREKKMEYIKRAREAGYTYEEIGNNISLTKSAIAYMLKNNTT